MPDTFYRRNLPHFHLDGYSLFITFRLADSLPIQIIDELKSEREQELKFATSKSSDELYEIEKRYFGRYDDWLDRCSSGPHWLEDERIASIVNDKIWEMKNLRYKLIAYCIMPNHVHMLIDHFAGEMTFHRGKSAKYPVTETLRLLKGSTARNCNSALERSGHFWHHESYDHFVRDGEELARVIQYILNNPVKAGLVKEWTDRKFSYVSPEYGEW